MYKRILQTEYLHISATGPSAPRGMFLVLSMAILPLLPVVLNALKGPQDPGKRGPFFRGMDFDGFHRLFWHRFSVLFCDRVPRCTLTS